MKEKFTWIRVIHVFCRFLNYFFKLNAVFVNRLYCYLVNTSRIFFFPLIKKSIKCVSSSILLQILSYGKAPIRHKYVTFPFLERILSLLNILIPMAPTILGDSPRDVECEWPSTITLTSNKRRRIVKNFLSHVSLFKRSDCSVANRALILRQFF